MPEHPSPRLVQQEISQVLVPGDPPGLFPYRVSGRRRDAAQGACAFALAAHQIVAHFPGCTVNSGEMRFAPGAFNIVPERVTLALEYRAPDPASMQRLRDVLLDRARREAEGSGLELEVEPLPGVAPAAMDPGVQVAFAAATDDARPTRTGVLTRIDGKELTMAATDGFRLSVKSVELPTKAAEPFDVVIPARALNELSRIVDDSVEEVYIEMPQGRNQVIFDMDSVVLVTQLIEGNFPDFRPVIPSRHSTRTILNAGDFAQACKMAEIFARESSHTARVRVEPGNELMPGYASITATSAETGDNVAQIDATVEGDEVEIAFNVRYMSQVLGVMDAPQVALETTRSTEPGVLKAVGDDSFLHIIMPMHFGR